MDGDATLHVSRRVEVGGRNLRFSVPGIRAARQPGVLCSFFARLSDSKIMFLDLLHEDMNRISKKPYIEYPVYTSFSPEQSDEMWSFHLQRNESPIIDWFYGQTVTFVRCTECGEVGS